jgi:tripartite-type tricarboxylate transporter receptor subunit TctC
VSISKRRLAAIGSGILVAAMTAGMATTALAQSNFPERDIEFIVGYNPGGGYSNWAQAVAPYIEEHLPNDVNVRVRHMPGAGSVVAQNYLYRQQPDGYTIGIVNLGGLAAAQAAEDVPFDLTQMTWLGRLSLDPTIMSVRADSDIRTVEDFMARDSVRISTQGMTASSTITAAVTLDEMGMDWTPINHDGTSEAVLSVVRGDADAIWGSMDSQVTYVRNGDTRILMYYDAQRHPDYPDAPIPSEVGFPEALNEGFNSNRVIGAPGGMDPDVRAILEEAIRLAVEDPDFQEQLDRMGVSAQYADGDATAEIVRSSVSGFTDYADVISSLLSE